MSEVTELTNEQELRKRARKWLMDNFDLRWKWAGDHTLSNEDRACMELAAFAQAELLRRLSTQGAGPRCPKCGHTDVRIYRGMRLYIGCHGCAAKIYVSELADFAQFFRAPSDPHEHGREVKR